MPVERTVAIPPNILNLELGFAPKAKIATSYKRMTQFDAKSRRSAGNIVIGEIGARIGSGVGDDDARLRAVGTDGIRFRHS